LASGHSDRKNQDLQFHLKINSFLLLQILCWLWIVLDDITESAAPHRADYVLAITAAISPIQGMGNAIIFNTAASTDDLIEKKSSSSHSRSLTSTELGMTSV
jgi:hypothetical protein